MDFHNSQAICRICLENGAMLPIFESKEGEDSIHSKLFLCLNEMVEDVAGYPRNICELCHITLNTVCKFIRQYKDSCKLLQNGLQTVIKQEISDDSDYFCNDQVEYGINDEKFQAKIEFDNAKDFMELVKPLSLKIKKAGKLRIKKENKQNYLEGFETKTNRTASSILEGNYIWNGEEWRIDFCEDSLPAARVKSNAEKKNSQRGKGLPAQKAVSTPPLPPEPVLCDFCGELFKTRDKLTLHKHKVHFKHTVNCPICLKSLSSTSLKKHTRRLHSHMEWNHVCSACGRRFPFQNELSRHYRVTHDKIERAKAQYACKICDKKYACAKSVLIHERSAHTGERPATCDVCGKSFYHEDYLGEHMRLHTGEAPFKCPVCGRGHAQRGNMKSHLRVHRVAELDAATLSTIKPSYLKLMKM